MVTHSHRSFTTRAGILSAIFLLALPGLAYAHVKWFCAFDVAGQPKFLKDVLCTDFGRLAIVSILLLITGAITERTALGDALMRSLDRTTSLLRMNMEMLIRVTVGGFFVALWARGGVLLTPELTTSVDAISWLQLAIAAGLIWRPTMVFSAAGIAALYAIGLKNAGLFHMLDYPIFLGLALYLALASLGRSPLGMRPVDIIRWSAAITLMWASIEKWAYPQWTFPLLVTHQSMTLGLDRDFYMLAAGMVEFALAFALACRPLVRRSAAAILTGMFVSAVPEFGKIDAIGHAPIVAVMVAILADDARARLRSSIWYPVGYVAALALFIAGYYGLHAKLFGTMIGLTI